MNRIILSTAITLAMAAPAFASDQLAISLGVEPGAYSTTQLVDLRQARESDDRARVNFILSGNATYNTLGVTERGAAVASARHIEEGNFREAKFVSERGAVASDTVQSSRTPSAQSAGLQQIAASAGIDAEGLTAGQLVDLARAIEEGDQTRVTGILSHAAN